MTLIKCTIRRILFATTIFMLVGSVLSAKGKLTLVGLATDYCVAFSALDAEKLGYAVTVRLDMARGIDTDGSLNAAIDRMAKAGINLVNG